MLNIVDLLIIYRSVMYKYINILFILLLLLLSFSYAFCDLTFTTAFLLVQYIAVIILFVVYK